MRLRQVFRFGPWGGVRLEVTYTPFSWQDQKLKQPGRLDFYLPRLGLRFRMPRGFDRLAWYGRGPQESYPDKKTGAMVGYYRMKVADTHEPYIYPQENGSHADTRFVAVYDAAGRGLLIAGEDFSFSAHHYTQEALTRATHSYELKEEELTEVCVDGAMGPLGSNSCGPERWRRQALSARAESSAWLSPVDGQQEDLRRSALRLRQDGEQGSSL